MNEKFSRLPQSMQDAILGLKELHNTPDSMAIVCVLAVANMATARLYNIDSGKYGIRPTSLFLVNLASTGASSNTVSSLIRAAAAITRRSDSASACANKA